MSWLPGGESDLDWIASVAVEVDSCGYDVGPMPEAVLVLHPIYARLDGMPMGEDDLRDWRAGPLPSGYRRMPWSEYATHHNVPMFVPGRGVGHYSLKGIWTDPFVDSPREGTIDDPAVWDALFAVLLGHSTDGAETQCTAYYDPFWLHNPAPHKPDPHILKGRLGDHRSLYDRPAYSTPQNLWPDERNWVLLTHSDAWATQISGPTELTEALMATQILDTIRVADLP